MNRGATFATLLLALPLVLLPALTKGKELILGEAGEIAQLPCKASKKENMDFTWKQPDQVVLLRGLRKGSTSKMIGNTKKKERVDSFTNQWDGGSFPLIIKKLEISDSDSYFCEVEKQKQEVQLLVFKVTVNPTDSPLSGKDITLTLHTPSNSPAIKVEWSGPGDASKRILSQDKKTLNLVQIGTKEAGDWYCKVSSNDKTLTLKSKITVLGFTSSSQSLFKMAGKAAKFSFPLTLNEQELNREQPSGELLWQVEGDASPRKVATFSWKSDSLTLEKGAPNFHRDSKSPFEMTLSPVLPQHAGSGVLSLRFSSGTLEQKISLVVMRAVSQESHQLLCCDVLGPIIPGLRLRWIRDNQTEINLEVSKEQRQLEVKKPKPGTWECQLSQDNELLKSDSIKLTPKTERNLSFHLGIGLGAGASLLLLSGLSIFCCARRRHRLRRAERMSQIRRLLSEKKTCQCPHRF